MTEQVRAEGKKNSTIPHTRIPSELKACMDKAIAELNRDSYLSISVTEFVKQAIRYYSNLVLTKQVGFSFKEPNGSSRTN